MRTRTVRLRQTHPASEAVLECEVEEASGGVSVSLGGSELELEVHGNDLNRGLVTGKDGKTHAFALVRAGDALQVWLDGRLFIFEPAEPAGPSGGTPSTFAGDIPAPMPGRVVQVLVEPGQAVAAGEPLAIMESMKMELVIEAPADAVVRRVAVTEGEQVERGMRLLELERPGG